MINNFLHIKDNNALNSFFLEEKEREMAFHAESQQTAEVVNSFRRDKNQCNHYRKHTGVVFLSAHQTCQCE